jgi:hypothetical protein
MRKSGWRLALEKTISGRPVRANFEMDHGIAVIIGFIETDSSKKEASDHDFNQR